MTVVVPQESVLGPLLREKTKDVVNALIAANPAELKKNLKEQGYVEILGFKVLASQVRFEDRSVRETGRRVIPHVVEPSYGAERIVYSTLEYAYTRVKDRVVLRIPPDLAPLKMMVLPLMAKDGLPAIAEEVTSYLLGEGFEVEYDDAGTIGRRYARADEVGVPISVTIDYGTQKDRTVTLRDRDTWKQVRNVWEAIPGVVRPFFRGETTFDALGTPVNVVYE
jgi:glycyl-tRNA synthetase